MVANFAINYHRVNHFPPPQGGFFTSAALKRLFIFGVHDANNGCRCRSRSGSACRLYRCDVLLGLRCFLLGLSRLPDLYDCIDHPFCLGKACASLETSASYAPRTRCIRCLLSTNWRLPWALEPQQSRRGLSRTLKATGIAPIWTAPAFPRSATAIREAWRWVKPLTIQHASGCCGKIYPKPAAQRSLPLCTTLEKRNSPAPRSCAASMPVKARAHAANSPAGFTAKTTPATAENACSLAWSNAAGLSGSCARCRHERRADDEMARRQAPISQTSATVISTASLLCRSLLRRRRVVLYAARTRALRSHQRSES